MIGKNGGQKQANRQRNPIRDAVTTNQEGTNHLLQPSILWYDFLDCCIANTHEHGIWNIFCASIAQGGSSG